MQQCWDLGGRGPWKMEHEEFHRACLDRVGAGSQRDSGSTPKSYQTEKAVDMASMAGSRGS